MTATEVECGYYADVRWQCHHGHFLADDSVQEETTIDPGEYYGISTRIWATCTRCGHVDNPRLVEVGQRPYRLEVTQ